MSYIIMQRGGGFRDMLRAYQIIIDGHEAGNIRRNSEVRVPVLPGPHTVQIKIDWCSSPELTVSVDAGLSAVLQCGPNYSSSQYGDRGNYVWLNFAEQSRPGESNRSTNEKKRERNSEDQERNKYRGNNSYASWQNGESEEEKNHVKPTCAAWYETLQVSPDSSMKEIRNAYRHRMSEYHPDKVAQLGDEIRQVADRKSKEINAAYEEASRNCRNR